MQALRWSLARQRSPRVCTSSGCTDRNPACAATATIILLDNLATPIGLAKLGAARYVH